jgi:hypothetical protein
VREGGKWGGREGRREGGVEEENGGLTQRIRVMRAGGREGGREGGKQKERNGALNGRGVLSVVLVKKGREGGVEGEEEGLARVFPACGIQVHPFLSTWTLLSSLPLSPFLIILSTYIRSCPSFPSPLPPSLLASSLTW